MNPTKKTGEVRCSCFTTSLVKLLIKKDKMTNSYLQNTTQS